MNLFRKPKLSPEEADRLPPGQTLTDKWPVLTYGNTQQVAKADLKLVVTGAVEQEMSFTFDQLLELPVTQLTADFHCVTGWSRYDNAWEGVLVRDLLERAGVKPEATHAMAYSYGNYTTNMPLSALLDDDAILAYKHDGEDIEADHGGPLRLIIPKLYAYKSAKWIRGLEILAGDEPGFWERGGYHMEADPWKEERFGAPFLP